MTAVNIISLMDFTMGNFQLYTVITLISQYMVIVRKAHTCNNMYTMV